MLFTLPRVFVEPTWSHSAIRRRQSWRGYPLTLKVNALVAVYTWEFALFGSHRLSLSLSLSLFLPSFFLFLAVLSSHKYRHANIPLSFVHSSSFLSIVLFHLIVKQYRYVVCRICWQEKIKVQNKIIESGHLKIFPERCASLRVVEKRRLIDISHRSVTADTKISKEPYQYFSAEYQRLLLACSVRSRVCRSIEPESSSSSPPPPPPPPL